MKLRYILNSGFRKMKSNGLGRQRCTVESKESCERRAERELLSSPEQNWHRVKQGSGDVRIEGSRVRGIVQRDREVRRAVRERGYTWDGNAQRQLNRADCLNKVLLDCTRLGSEMGETL
jgi:hypothetical protein